MDARERDEAHLRRTSSIKRPWGDDPILLEPSRVWHRTTLPPIDAAPYQRTPVSRGEDHEARLENRYGPDFGGEQPAKRARYEGHEYDYNSLSQEDLNLNLNGKLIQAQNTSKLRI
jgi:hypothetical protein